MNSVKAIRRPAILYINWAKYHKFKNVVLILFSVWIAFVLYSIWPKQVAYSFSGESCTSKVTILPNTFSTSNKDFNYNHQDYISILGKPILAKKVCFNIAKMVDEGSQVIFRLHPLDLKLLGQNYHIKVPNFPNIDTSSLDLNAIPLTSTLSLPLNKQDNIFEYRLNINSQTTNCSPSDSKINCDVGNLGLKHNTEYSAHIDRYFNNNIKPATTLKLKTVEPMSIVESSVNDGQELITKLDTIVITTDRPIESVKELELKSGTNVIGTEHNIANNVLTIKLPPNLARGQSYILNIKQLFGQKNESLVEPFNIDFRLLNGPSISSSNLSDRATPLDSKIILYFDQPLAEYDHKSYLKLTASGIAKGFTVYKTNNQLHIIPAGNFNRCESIKISYTGPATNKYGVANELNWQYNSRAMCASSFNLGNSVEGRPIVAYRFGTGAREVLYVGALHGDEYNSKRILEEWMWELEGNPGKIPAGTTVTVVPSLNPDGIAKKSRYNANGVDLNRNFATNNWKKDVVIQDGTTLTNGGGSNPLSEPESAAIANYIKSSNPSLTLTYHSQGNIVESNEAGSANEYAQKYSSLSGYGFKLASSNTGFFKYDVNGSLEEWAKDELGIPAILVELSTRVYHDFSRNRNAMWAML